MREFMRKLFRWPTLVVVSLIHLGSGVVLILDPSSVFSTPLYPLSHLYAPAAGLGLLGITALGLWALVQKTPSWKTLLALLPQQTMLVLSSSAIAYSIAIGKFLDGVPRSRSFLTGDHIAVMALTVVHAIVLVLMHSNHVFTKRTRLTEPADPERISRKEL